MLARRTLGVVGRAPDMRWGLIGEKCYDVVKVCRIQTGFVYTADEITIRCYAV